MGEFLVRLATEADDVAVGELLVRAFVDAYARKHPDIVVAESRRADLRATAAKRAVATVWVAEHEGAVVGTVALWAPGAPGSEAWLPTAANLKHLALAPDVPRPPTGRRLSAWLMDEAEAHARALGADAICLHVRRGIDGVRRLYEARGYQRAPEGDLDRLPLVYLEAFALRLR